MTEQAKFMQWYDRDKANGLIDFKIFPGEIKAGTTTEDLFRDLNEINALIDSGAEVQRADVF